MKKSCSDRRADLAVQMDSSPSRIPSRLLGFPSSASRFVVPLAFVTYMTGTLPSRESVLPFEVMFASVQRHHAPHSCAVLLTDNETTIGCEGCTRLLQQLRVLRYPLPYSSDATEMIPGRRVRKHVCNNRLATPGPDIQTVRSVCATRDYTINIVFGLALSEVLVVSTC